MVVAAIEQIREHNEACTAAAVAHALKISRAYMSDVMHEMIERDILTFNPEIPGSLRLTKTARAELFPVEAAGRHVCNEPGCEWPTKAALDGHSRVHRSTAARSSPS
jgi:hypothetical protein